MYVMVNAHTDKINRFKEGFFVGHIKEKGARSFGAKKDNNTNAFTNDGV